jgi:cytochrome P450
MAERGRRLAAGEQLDAEEDEQRIAQHLRLLLFAAYGTTAGATSRILIEFLRRGPVWEERLRHELGADRVGEPVTLGQINDTPETDLFLREALRLFPAQHLIVRGCAQDWEIHGCVVPTGWIVIVPALLNHRDPEAFPNPEAFDPERFRSPSPEQARLQRQALAIFGQGQHACPGQHLAWVEMKAILARLLRDFDVRLQQQDARWLDGHVFDPAGRPKSGTRIRVTRRDAA